MTFDELENIYPNRVERPTQEAEIPSNVPLVYILTINETPIVVGHGKSNRAKVIFDSKSNTTSEHIKAMTVRLHTLFGYDGAVTGRYLIRCTSKEEAKVVESVIHRKFGGNTLVLPECIQNKLFDGLPEDSVARMVLRMALCSSFSGLADIKKWRRERVFGESVWKQIREKLQLHHWD